MITTCISYNFIKLLTAKINWHDAAELTGHLKMNGQHCITWFAWFWVEKVCEHLVTGNCLESAGLTTNSIFFVSYLYRKGLKARYLTARLAFRQPLRHPTHSVFHADQRGIGGFLILTLGPEFWGHPHPHGEPQHQQGQGLILEHSL